MSEDPERSLLRSGGELSQMVSAFEEQRTEEQDDYPDEALPVICCCIVILFVIMIILLLMLSTHYSGEIGDETNTGKATYLSVTKGGGNPPAQVPSLATTSEVVTPGPRERTTPGMTTSALVSAQSQWLSTTSGSDAFGPGNMTTQPLTPSTSTSSYPVPSPPTLPVTTSRLTTSVPVTQKTTTPPTPPPTTTPSTARTTPSTTSSTRRTTTRSTTRPTTTTATTTTTTSTTRTTTTTTTSTTTTTTTTSTTTTTTTTTTTSTTTSTTTRPTTTPPASTTPGYNFTPLPGKPQRNFTLICVFEYILRAQYIWPKIDQCTDYVYIGAFTYFDDTRVNHDTLEFTKKTLKSKGFDVYLGTDPKYWEYINGARRAVAQVKKYVYPHADWYIGIWGSTYLRLLVSFWEPLRIRDSLHAYLRQPVIGGSNLTSFDGFAIINTILRDGRGEHQAYLTFNYSIFRGRNNPILPPSWRYIHTAAVWPPGSISRVPEVLVKNIIGNCSGVPLTTPQVMLSLLKHNCLEYGADYVLTTARRVADIVGLSTSNTTDEPNRLHQARDSPGFYWASPPNPIRPPNDKMRGMLDMLLEFPHWKAVLNRSNLCFSVTSSINYARDDTVPIDFIKELSRISDNVVRYTRLRFISRINGTQQYPVEDNKMKYEFDNRTHTHFWKAHFYSGPLMSFFAYDNADTLRYKMQELLNAYPGDRCVVFDDLGDDYHEGGFQYDGHTVEFKKYGLLNVVASSMVQRYGTAFPPQYY